MPSSQYQNGGSWPVVAIEHPPELAEALAHFLFENGATALIQETSPGDSSDQTRRYHTQAGFPQKGPAEGLPEKLLHFLEKLNRIFHLQTPSPVEWRRTPHGDWAEKWKEGFSAVEIGPLVVKPSWVDYEPRPGQTMVELDPGLAFGTGRHETTRMCLELLCRFLEASPGPNKILDLGTGSGILALAAAALGRNQVIAIDHDFQATAVAAENLAANRLTSRVRLACAEPGALKGRFDLILANLTAGPLIELASELGRLAAPAAHLGLSGILDSQAEAVVLAYQEQGFNWGSCLNQGGWTALWLFHGKTA